MPKFRLSCAVTVSAYTEVQAKSLEEAIEIAEARQVVLSLGVGCGAAPEEDWVIDAADGVPCDIRQV